MPPLLRGRRNSLAASSAGGGVKTASRNMESWLGDIFKCKALNVAARAGTRPRVMHTAINMVPQQRLQPLCPDGRARKARAGFPRPALRQFFYFAKDSLVS